MRFVTGDECGVLKESLPIPRKEKLDVTGGHVKLLTPVEQMDRSNGIIDLKWWSDDGDERSFGAVLKDGRVQEFSITIEAEASTNTASKPNHGVYKVVRECPKLYRNADEGKEVAIGLHRFQTNNNSKVCVCSSKGQINIFDMEKFAEFDDDDEGAESSLSSRDRIVQSLYAYHDKKTKEIVQDVLVAAHASNSDAGLLAVGGKERETVLFDLNAGKPIWIAKNLPPDPQTLLHPLVWPTAACFMGKDILAIGTAYHQVRIYDVRLTSQQRRPVAYSPFDKSLFGHRITALCCPNKKPQQQSEQTNVGGNNDVLLVGDSAGFLMALDIRMLRGGAILRETSHKAVVGRYVGPSGSIRHIQAHTNGHVACVGLDRMLRVFDMKSRRQVHAIYLKQRVNCLLMSMDNEASVETETPITDDSDVDVEDEIEDYVGSSEEGDSEDDANPFDDDEEEDKEQSSSKKRRT
jgi:hypothetical protein